MCVLCSCVRGRGRRRDGPISAAGRFDDDAGDGDARRREDVDAGETRREVGRRRCRVVVLSCRRVVVPSCRRRCRVVFVVELSCRRGVVVSLCHPVLSSCDCVVLLPSYLSCL